MERAGAGLLLLGDVGYPALLGAIPDPPVALWIRGSLRDEDRMALAMVGSRRCTAYGRSQADRLAALLGQCGLTIVSGGAIGVDAAAHRGALRAAGRTVAVLGCGLGRCYPSEHDRLYEQIVESGGAVLAELPMDAPPRPGHFPRRNRIISGLSLGVLVIEAARRSGALITARQAAEEHGREVMVLPGRVDSRTSRGGLEAVRDGWAGLVIDHIDVLRQMDSSRHLVRGALDAGASPDTTTGDAGTHDSAPAKHRAEPAFVQRLNAVQGSIVDVLRDLDGEPAPIEHLSARTGLSVQRVLAELTVLQIMGVADRREEGVVLGGVS
jgi:DNA processing protein